NREDVDGVEAAFHPDFEMIVPHHPARGFKGRDQEVRNMRTLMTTHPEGRIEVRRVVESGNEVWVQSRYTSDALEMEAVVIYEIDPTTDTILVGHHYSEEVDRGGPEINAWIDALGHLPQTQCSAPDRRGAHPGAGRRTPLHISDCLLTKCRFP